MVEHKFQMLNTLLGVLLVYMIPNWLWLVISAIVTGAGIYAGQKMMQYFLSWFQKKVQPWLLRIIERIRQPLPKKRCGERTGAKQTKKPNRTMKKFLLFMGLLTFLVIHCTATPEGRSVTGKDIKKWHIEQRGWHQVGYSDMIHQDGTIENLVPHNTDNYVDQWEITNGVSGINGISRHIVYVGGTDKELKPKDTRTDQQKQSLYVYCLDMIKKWPNIKIGGHNQWINKACPSFDVPKWLKSMGIPDKNIYRPQKVKP